MIKSGKFFIETPDGVKSVRTDPMEIINELQESVKNLKGYMEDVETELADVKSEKFRDETIKKLQEENGRLLEKIHYGFSVSKEEHERIGEWIDDWCRRKNGGSKYFGAVGGAFTYKFIPTSIGTSGVIIAPDGEEFEFQKIDG